MTDESKLSQGSTARLLEPLFLEAKFVNPQNKTIAHKKEAICSNSIPLPLAAEAVLLKAWIPCGSQFVLQLSLGKTLLVEEGGAVPITEEVLLDTAHSLLNSLPKLLFGIDESPVKFDADFWYRIRVTEEGALEYEFHVGTAGKSAPKKRLEGVKELAIAPLTSQNKPGDCKT